MELSPKEKFFDGMANSLTALFFYFEILDKLEAESDFNKKIKELELLVDLKQYCKEEIPKIRTLMHKGF